MLSKQEAAEWADALDRGLVATTALIACPKLSDWQAFLAFDLFYEYDFPQIAQIIRQRYLVEAE